MYGRLVKEEHFREVYAKGKLRFGRFFAVHALAFGGDTSYFGISVSKKVGKAVVRNKIKRRIREILRKLLPSISPGYHVIIGCKKRASEATFRDLEADLFSTMKEVGLIRKNNRR